MRTRTGCLVVLGALAACGRGALPAAEPSVVDQLRSALESSWATNVSYAIGDRVVHAGIIYECRQAHTSQSTWTPPSTPALWARPTPFCLSPWAAQTRYEVGSDVTYQGRKYECIQAHVADPPTWTPPATPNLWRCASPACGGTCSGKPAGALCDDGNSATDDACDGAGNCVSTPVGTCGTPVLGTVGMVGSSALGQIQTLYDGELRGAWRVSLDDEILPGQIGDLDNDGRDDFLVRSASALGVLGYSANNTLRSKAVANNGASLGAGWTLAAADLPVAVGRFGAATNPAMVVLRNGGTGGGLAFVKISGSALSASSVTRWGATIRDSGMTASWTLAATDRILGVGKFNGVADCLVVAGSSGLALLVPSSTGSLSLLARLANGDLLSAGTGRDWKLDTADPRLRLAGDADIDKATDKKAELVLVSGRGVVILHKKSSGVVGPAAFDTYFMLRPGEYFPGTSVSGTQHYLAEVAELDGTGGADLLYHTESGVTVLGKTPGAWSFSAVAEQLYFPYEQPTPPPNPWNLSGDDQMSAFTADFNGDGRRDLVSVSPTRLNLPTVSGSNLVLAGSVGLDVAGFQDPDLVVGLGVFDRFDLRSRLLWKVRRIFLPPPRPAVTTYHNDPGRTGVNSLEEKLTQDAVRDQGLTKVRTIELNETGDEHILGQVLYVPGLTIQNAVHDMAFVGTLSNRLYAFDVKTGAFLPSPTLAFKDETMNTTRTIPMGIRGTPVYDPARRLIYLVFGAESSTADKVGFWLVAWDPQEMKEKARVEIAGSVPRYNDEILEFDATQHTQRASLLLANNLIYLTFTARFHEEDHRYHGWVFSYQYNPVTASFQPHGVFCTSPNEVVGYAGPGNAWPWANGAGIWQGGGGLAGDALGNVYFMTGNAPADSARDTLGDSFVKLIARGDTMQMRRAWAPANATELWQRDWDLGSGGPMLIPGTTSLVGGGKEGALFVLDRETMLPSDQHDTAFQNQYDSDWRCNSQWAGGPHLHGQPVYFRNGAAGTIFHQAEHDILRGYRYLPDTKKLDRTAIESSDKRLTPQFFWSDQGEGYMRGQLALSSRGTTPGSAVLWTVVQAREDDAAINDRQSGCNHRSDMKPVTKPMEERLTAYKPEDGTCLWSTTIKKHLDAGASGEHALSKTMPPTVADGRVILATGKHRILIFELDPTSTEKGGCQTIPLPACKAPDPCGCGKLGQGCCAGSFCTEGGCSGEICTAACGAKDQTCCGGTTCNAGLTCDEDLCKECGAPGQDCCANQRCNPGLRCSASKCTM